MDELRDEKFWVDLAASAHAGSTNYFDSFVRPKVEKNIRQFQSQFAGDSKYLTEAYRLKSKVFRPKTRSMVRKNEAVAASAFFSTEDVTSIRPVDDNNPVHRAAASMYRYLLQHRLTKSIPWFITLIGAYQEAMVSKVVASAQYWEYDQEKKIDRPKVKLIELENLRIDPGADWTDPVGTSPYVIWMIPMFVKDVKARMGSGKWYQVSDKDLLAARTNANDSTRMVREGRGGGDSKDSATRIDDYSIVWVHENHLVVDGRDVVFHTLGTVRLLSDPVPLKEKYFHGIRPFVIGHCNIEAHKVFPDAPVELVSGTQDEINDVANQRLENVKLVLNKRWQAKRNKNVDIRSLTRNVAGSVTMVTDHDDIKHIDTPDVTGSSYQEQDRLNLDFDDVSGAFSGSSVASNRKLNETVGGMNILTTQSNLVGEYQLRTFVETWVEPVLRQLILLEREYENDDLILQLATQDAEVVAAAVDLETLFRQEVILTVNVGIGNTNPQNQVERFIYGLTSLKNLLGDQVLQQANTEEIVKELFGKLGYRDGSRFFKLGEEQQQDPMQQKMMELQIQELEAKIRYINSQTGVKNVETLYSSMQAAQTAATVPGVVPIADEIAKSAGFVDQNAAPLFPYPAPPAAGAEPPVAPAMPAENTSPMFPANPDGAGEGMMQGIETQRNDGVQQ